MPYKDPEKRKEAQKRYWASHALKLNETRRSRYQNDESYRLRRSIEGKNYDPNKKVASQRMRRNLIRVDRQGEVCGICGKEESITFNGIPKLLAQDHSHSTGLDRGRLCMRCNTALGLVDDNIEILDGMVEYLLKHSEV